MDSITILFLGFAGFMTYKLLSYKNSGQKSKHSPMQFDVKYWLSDRNNWNDGLLGMILFVFIAKYKDVIFSAFADNFIVAFIAPYKDNEILYFIIGFLMTFIIKLFRKLIQYIADRIKKLQ